MQELLLLPSSLHKQERLEEELNIVHPLNFPYNLFLNLSELLNPDAEYVYFFAYILGREKVVMWGVYSKAEKDFYIEGSCRYSPGQLYAMTKAWKEQGQTYVANTVRNRIEDRLAFYLNEPRLDYQEYLKLKFLLGYLEGKITLEVLERRYPHTLEEFLNSVHPLSPHYELELHEKEEELKSKVEKYEETINRLDISSTLGREVSSIVARITKRFKHKMELENGLLVASYPSLTNCPSWEECQEKKEDCQVFYYGSRYTSERDLA